MLNLDESMSPKTSTPRTRNKKRAKADESDDDDEDADFQPGSAVSTSDKTSADKTGMPLTNLMSAKTDPPNFISVYLTVCLLSDQYFDLPQPFPFHRISQHLMLCDECDVNSPMGTSPHDL